MQPGLVALIALIAVGEPCCAASGSNDSQPVTKRWDSLMSAGNHAVMRGDLEAALRYYSRLEPETSDKCLRVFARANVQATKDALRDVRKFKIARGARYGRYMRYLDKYWQGNPCNR